MQGRGRSRSSDSMRSETGGNSFPQPEPCNRVYIAHLPTAMTGDKLTEICSDYGDVTDAKVIVKDDDFAFGFVSFQTAVHATGAVENLNGKKINEKFIKVSFAKPRPPREGGDGPRRGGFEGRGGDRGRDQGFQRSREKPSNQDRPTYGRSNDFNRGGREGGMGGGRGPIKCFKCQQEGHISRNCPESEGGPPRRDNRDYGNRDYNRDNNRDSNRNQNSSDKGGSDQDEY